MEQVILERMRSKLLERTSIDTLPDSTWKRIAALNTWGTNAIEGSTISRSDAERILFDDKTPGGKPMRDVIETLQHERSFRGLLERRKRNITLETILELHEEVFRLILPDAGQWRRANVRIKSADFIPPRMEKVLDQMEKWVKTYNQRDVVGENIFFLGS